MIGSLRGTIQDRIDDIIIIDVHGVGYEVTATNAVLDSLPSDEISLTVYTDVRETAISLFGFVNRLEREVFLLLKKVKGVGSKLALTIVSSLGAEGVLSAVGTANVTVLRGVPGVGKKTAERLLVELGEQVGEYAVTIPTQRVSSVAGDTTVGNELPAPLADAVLALEKLGFSTDKAKQAVSTAAEKQSGALDAGDLLRSALGHL